MVISYAREYKQELLILQLEIKPYRKEGELHNETSTHRKGEQEEKSPMGNEDHTTFKARRRKVPLDMKIIPRSGQEGNTLAQDDEWRIAILTVPFERCVKRPMKLIEYAVFQANKKQELA